MGRLVVGRECADSHCMLARFVRSTARTTIPLCLLATILAACGSGTVGGNSTTTTGRTNAPSRQPVERSAAATRPSAPTPAAVPVPAQVQDSYLTVGSDFVNLFQFTRDGTRGFAGVLYDAQISDAEAIDSKTLPISGTISGGTVSITISGQTPILGSLDDRAHIMTLNLPQPDGTIAPEDFYAADVSAYNEAVKAMRASLNADIRQGNKKLKSEAALAATKARTQTLRDAGDKLGRNAADALLAYRQALTARAIAIHDLAAPVATANSSLAAAEKQIDAAQTEAAKHPDGSNGQVCVDASDAGIAAGDAAIAAHDAGYPLSDARTAVARVPAARNAGANVYLALARAITAAKGYVPASSPSGYAGGTSFPIDDSVMASADRATDASAAASLATIVRTSKDLQARARTICASVSG